MFTPQADTDCSPRGEETGSAATKGMTMAEMAITDGKGVVFTMDNGLCVSVQIGRGNYSDNYNLPREYSTIAPLPASSKAEIAVYDAVDADMAKIETDIVKGYVPVEHVLRFIEFLRALPPGLDRDNLETHLRSFDWQGA